MTTQRLSVAALTLAAALVLSGCGSAETPAEPRAVATTVESATPSSAAATSPARFPSEQLPRAEVERLFVAQVETSGFIPRYGDAAASLALADLVCVHFNQGGTMAGLLDTVLPGATITESEFREFAAVAAVAFCPENVKAVFAG